MGRDILYNIGKYFDVRGLYSPHVKDEYLRCELTIAFGCCINAMDHIHALHYFSECGIALTVRIVDASKIIPWLVSNTYKELGVGSTRCLSRKRDRSIFVRKFCLGG